MIPYDMNNEEEDARVTPWVRCNNCNQWCHELCAMGKKTCGSCKQGSYVFHSGEKSPAESEDDGSTSEDDNLHV